MPHIDSDSPAITKAVAHLVAVLERAGARIDPRLEIVCRCGDLSFRCPTPGSPNTTILGLPSACLLPVDQFRLALAEDEIRLAGHGPKITPKQLNIMRAVIDVFNLTGKIAHHRATHPSSLAATLPDLHSLLSSGRNKPPEGKSVTDQHDPLVRSMLKTRTLAYKAEAASDCPTDVIMPLVDFANHHPLAPPYMNFVDQSRNAMLVLKEFCPDPATRECYVRYGIYDAYDTFLYYGYVERRAPFVCSIPMELKLPGGGMITVHAFGSRTVRKDLPKPIADLAFFMPNFTADAEQRTAEVSHLIIPQGNAPRALRRVLAVIVHAVDPHLNVDEITAVVATIEPRILARNVEFYEKLRARLQQVDAPPEPAAIVAATRDVTDVQLAKLRQYPFFIASGGGGAGHTPAEAPG